MLPINPFSRPGTKRTSTEGIVMHWTSVPKQSAKEVERYFMALGDQDTFDDIPDRYGSAHMVIGIDGEAIQLIPWDEVAYHAGGANYKWRWRDAYPEYSRNTRGGTPNYALIGIELCHPTATGEFTDNTLEKARAVMSLLMSEYTLGVGDIYRHYDITGKVCPKYWVENRREYDRFLSRWK